MVGGLVSKTSRLVLDTAHQPGLVEPSSVTLTDYSRFKNNGAMANVTWVQLPSGLWVMSFNGVNSEVNCGDGASLKIIRAITLEAWAIYSTAKDFNPIISKYPAYNLRQRSANEGFTATLRDVDDGTTLAEYGGTYANRYFYIVGTWTIGDYLRLYRNGVQLAISAAILNKELMVNTTPCYIGRWQTVRSNMRIVFVRIRYRALTHGQVITRFEATRHWFGA